MQSVSDDGVAAELEVLHARGLLVAEVGHRLDIDSLARHPTDTLQLNDIVKQTVSMLRRVIGEHIAIDTRLAPDLPLIFADASSVDQIIMNLALNSRDAMPDGGRLTIETANAEIDEEFSGAVIEELGRRGGQYGLATLCLGGGGSVAMAFERV